MYISSAEGLAMKLRRFLSIVNYAKESPTKSVSEWRWAAMQKWFETRKKNNDLKESLNDNRIA
ncbi:MAG: hypothetical protein DWQ19_12800 [Crenarchaeota archaeon]|nr:MAG: hypothetical protein DWQ19_12800 [Thermoproteota archaeon]